MKITVSLDSQTVITQPSPLRIKAGAFAVVGIEFTRVSRSVSLPQGTVIEFAIKPRNQWTGAALAYLNAFELGAGNVYTGTLNCASSALLGALGVNDSTPANDRAQLEASAEVTWLFGGQKFRSNTFPVIIETPLTDSTPIAAPDPVLYPDPASIALKSDLPKLLDLAPYALKSEIPVVGSAAALDAGEPSGVATLDAEGRLVESQVPESVAFKEDLHPLATEEEAIEGERADAVVSPKCVSAWYEAKFPGDSGRALLGDQSWGVPDLSGYTGALAGDGSNVTGVIGVGLSTFTGLGLYDDGSGQWVSNAGLQAPGFSGLFGASFTDEFGVWQFASGIETPWISGDGWALSNVSAIGLSSPFGASMADSGDGSWMLFGGMTGNWFAGSFIGDGSLLSNLTETDPVFSAWLESEPNISAFTNDAGYLSEEIEPLFNAWLASLAVDSGLAIGGAFSCEGGAVSTDGHGSLQATGSITAASFVGDGSLLVNIAVPELNSPNGSRIYDAGQGDWRVTGNLSAGTFSGSFSGDGSGLSNVYATPSQLTSPYGYSIYDTGSGNWQVNGNMSAGSFSGSFSGDGAGLYNVYATPSQITSPYGYTIYDTGWGNWSVNGNITASRFYGAFSGDGSGLSNVYATPSQLNSPYGYSIYDAGWGNWQVNGSITASHFSGDGSGLYNVYATPSQLNSPYGSSIYDTGWGNWQVNGNLSASRFYGAFSGDGSGLSNVYATPSQLTSPYGYSIYDAGWGNWQLSGSLTAGRFIGDGSGLYNVYATPSQLTSPYGYSIYDSGWGNWQVSGNLSAGRFYGAFSGDGSGLYNVYATPSQLTSPYGYSIYDTGGGNWQVTGSLSSGSIYGSFNGDGRFLQNVTALRALCDEYGNGIFGTYAIQSGYYNGLWVGGADLAHEAEHAGRASSDNWGNPLYGAGNIQWDFFGGSPSSGDVASFDGTMWRPAPATPAPLTVASAIERFTASGLKTGWMVKQLDNRTVYLVLDPKDCGSELGWVPLGPFLLIPANSEPLAISNPSPALGDTITCSAGTWSDNPTESTYQWYRNGEVIPDATSSSYTVMPEDDGCSLQCVVSASNAAGTGTDSATIPVVTFPA